MEDGLGYGFLNFDRSTLEEIDIDSIRKKKDSTQKVKTKTHSTIKPKIKDNQTEII